MNVPGLDKLKSIPPTYWVIGGGVLLLLVVLGKKGGGSTSTPTSSTVGGGGGGGDSSFSPDAGSTLAALQSALAANTEADTAFRTNVLGQLSTAAAHEADQTRQLGEITKKLGLPTGTTPPPTGGGTTTPPPTSGGGTSGTTYRTYTVKKGDTLWGIASRLLGSGTRWREIYNLNKGIIGANPSLIKPGQTLRLPSK